MCELKQFDKVFPELVEFLKTKLEFEDGMNTVLNHFEHVNQYNVPFGKKSRGIAVIESFKILKKNKVSEQDLNYARIVGWCIEWLQAMFLVHDDIMDNSITRRGQPCWFRQEDIALMAINDGLYLESAIYIILKAFCKSEFWYGHLVDLFHEITMKTIHGQALDMISSPQNRLLFEDFTLNRYETITKNKTAYYSFVLPIRCAMYISGNSNENDHKLATNILLQMGHYFQIQDDFLDAFGDVEVTGKIGTDIEDNKCSWLIVNALKKCANNHNLKKILEDNYGKSNPESVKQVKDCYKKLNLVEDYQQLEEFMYNSISEDVKKQNCLPNDVFFVFLDKIHKRQK